MWKLVAAQWLAPDYREQAMPGKRVIWFTAANLLGGAVLVLLLLDPARPLWPIFTLLGAGVVLMVVPGLLPPRS